MTACLDSWAVLAWLEGEEPAQGRVTAELARAPVMSWINLGEVWYVLARRRGEAFASGIVDDLRRRLDLDVPGAARCLAAAAIKARHPLAYADAFAVATAVGRGATLLTGDPELLHPGTGWPVEDLRPNR